VGELIKGMHDIDMNIVVYRNFSEIKNMWVSMTWKRTDIQDSLLSIKIIPLKPDQSLLDNVENGRSSENYPNGKILPLILHWKVYCQRLINAG